MAEYYIRTPDRDESRGPFTPAQILTLAEAGQVTIETLYYDDYKEEWLPIGTNAELREEVFPEPKKLKLKIDGAEEPEKTDKKSKKKQKLEAEKKAQNTISSMLATAEIDSKNARAKRKKEDSLKQAAHLTNNGLCLIMLLSAVTLVAPYLEEIKVITSSLKISLFLNYPLIILGLLDLLISVYVYFGDQKLHPILRGRAMLTLGFGIYIGWSLNAPYVLIASVCFGLGTLWATLAKRFSSSVLAVVLGLGGSSFLTYLSLTGYFNDIMHHVFFELFTN